MKKFTKLALVSSIALSANAMAMQAMDDSALSATTGQDGISIGIGISKVEIEKLFIHDNDGFTDATQGGTSTAGAIVIKGNGVGDTATKGVVIGANYDSLLASRNLIDLKIDSDAGTVANGGAFLNIAAEVSGLTIQIGEIGVTKSGDFATDSLRRGGNTNVRTATTNTDSHYNAILSGLEIVTGKMNANIQVGAAPQGAMIKLDTVIQGGLEIKNLGILDNSTKGVIIGQTQVRPPIADANGLSPTDAGWTPTYGQAVAANVATREAGEIFIESIKIADANGKDLTVDSDIQVFNNAYVGSSNTVGRAAHIRIVSNDTGAKDQYIKGIHLGSRNAGSIGDVEVQGLQTFYSKAPGDYTKGAVITISGH